MALWREHSVCKSAVVGYEQRSERILVESAGRKHILRPHFGRNKFHNALAVIVVGRADIALRLVEQYVPVPLRRYLRPADAYRGGLGVYFNVRPLYGSSVNFYASLSGKLLYLRARILRPLGYEFVKSYLCHFSPFRYNAPLNGHIVYHADTRHMA